MSRECTNQILEMVEEGLLDAKEVLRAVFSYITEDEVRDMCSINGIEWEAQDEDDEGEQE